MSFLIPVDARNSDGPHRQCPRRKLGGKKFTDKELAAVLSDVHKFGPPRSRPKTRTGWQTVAAAFYAHYQGPWSSEMPPFEKEDKGYPPPERKPQSAKPDRQYEELGIPPGPEGCYWKAMIGDFENLPTIPIGNVLVWGGNGVGKTHLAAALAKVRKARWVTGDNVSSREPERFLSSWFDHKHLVLDDLLRGKHTDVGLGSIVSFLARRIDENNFTIVTCDKSPSDIAGVDPALASRLGGFTTLRLRGGDRRRGIAQ